ncbi:DUF2752 domain-containing protein [Clostridium sp.]|uniref:DUF2752 domain-containing protein n=1 Tax=Clostridium sp. TaxID=1506 RepID=UPI0025C51849|nr:DUF2752 domain-containing protein [Clostridium sp.]
MSKLLIKLKFIAVVIFPILVYLIPVSAVEKNPAPCISRLLFNVECIGCGITRACLNALHFNFAQANEYNKLVFIVLPLCCICYVKYLIYIIQEMKN